MVGTTSEELESNGCEVLVDSRKSLEKDISEYLLLHHNYAAKPPTKNMKKTKANCRRKLKAIRPKIITGVSNTNKLAVDLNTPIIIESEVSNSDVICGSYSNDSNGVTIVVDDNGIPIEATTEVSTRANQAHDDEAVTVVDNSFFSVSTTFLGSVSPRSTSSSDNGYESLDSPQSLSDLDLWDQSVSELFPSLF